MYILVSKFIKQTIFSIMAEQILDGTGKGYRAKVDDENRLLTSGINKDIFQFKAETGDAFFIGTPLITLTTATESAIFYLKNNEDGPILLGDFFLIAEATTGGSPSMFRVNWYKNPTSISSATATTPLNQNFGSSDTLGVVAQYGAQGSTITGGSQVATLSFPISEFNTIPANLVLEKGSSFVVSILPPTGNTSMPVQFGTRSIRI